MPEDRIDPLFDSVRITVPPSPHRVRITIRPGRVETEILDIPDGDFNCPTVPIIHTEYVDGN